MLQRGFKKNKRALLLIALSFGLLCFASMTGAQTRRAFLVGIDEYSPGKNSPSPCRKRFSNLSGCINDVEAMAGILEARFAFKPGNIHVLINKKATRSNIIAQFEKYLVTEANPGDICVFYYSGHGSQVRNSKSTEPDGYDETLVPADSYRGVKDLRDKELKKLFNAVLDKQAQLTVIIDSCHCGSISRGIPAPSRYKFLPADECDAADPPGKEESPAKRGALFFTAAQDFDLAIETTDEDENDHGLFTWALLKVLRTVPIDEPAQNIILRVNALMHSEGRPQEPNLEGLQEQRMKPLFGIKPGTPSKVTAAVLRIENGSIILQGGIAAGIRENCELKNITVINGKDRSLETRVRVIAVQGLNQCTAKLIQGNLEKIHPGDLFVMDRWTAGPGSRMKSWIPVSTISFEELIRMAGEMKKLCDPYRIAWIDDPTEINPSFTMYYSNIGWILRTPGHDPVNLGNTPNANEVLNQLRLNLPDKKTKPAFFLQLPLSSEFNDFVYNEMAEYNDAVEFFYSDRDVHYVLGGRFNGGKIQYAWVLPNTVSNKEQALPLPVRTNWIPVEKTTSKEAIINLKEKIAQLAYVRAWLQLSSPPGNREFPYHLALKNPQTMAATTTGPLIEGEKYDPVLIAEKEIITGTRGIEKRYVYVFVIDSYGKGTLLFPLTELLNSENYFPVQKNSLPSEINLGNGGLFDITPPFGVDTYILLTTAEPVSNPEVLSFSGVRGGEVKGQLSPLEKLLAGVGLRKRGDPPVTHTNWSIERLSIQSKSKQK